MPEFDAAVVDHDNVAGNRRAIRQLKRIGAGGGEPAAQAQA